MIKFEVKGDLKKAIAAVTKNTEKTVQKEITDFTNNTSRDAQREVPVNEGILKNAIKPEIKRLSGRVTVASKYSAFVEFGTKRFAAAYVSTLPPDWQSYAASFKGKDASDGDFNDFVLRIMAWVKKKGLGATYNVSTRRKNRQTKDDLNSIAYAIAISIMRNGIREQPFLYPAYIKNKKKLLDNLGVK